MQIIHYEPLQKLESARKMRRESLVLQGKRLQPRWDSELTLRVLLVTIGLGLPVALLGLAQAKLAALLLGAVILVVLLNRQFRRQSRVVRDFAAANGWQYIADAEGLERLPAPSAVSLKWGREGLSGTLDGVQFWLYSSMFRLYSAGKEVQVLALRFDRSFPTFFLDAQADMALDWGFGLPDVQKVTLDADFGSAFTLYAKPGSEADVLAVLTPEIRQLLTERGLYVNILAEGEYLYLINTLTERVTYTFTQNLISCAQQLIPCVQSGLAKK